ncbi:hypothetical protein [Bifidobacterium pseudocatenulatum]|uniref:hypothetical protein n=1 Tax=Bifidobacterium pseudocatenulatum TaxID=28026 RepID=UPI00232AC638|nr:hypothetical protein [Bifidobacterium pseudocatenulatum]MDB6507792.1 hypothetical protein [Bifidobacterium pseudocatenulatum]
MVKWLGSRNDRTYSTSSPSASKLCLSDKRKTESAVFSSIDAFSSSVPNPPDTGEKQTLTNPSAEKSSTHWKKMDSYRLPSGKNPPDTGRISTPQTIPATQILHPLEESVRSQDRQRGDYSSGWKNTDSHTLPSGEIVPVDGRIETWTVLSRTWVEFTRIAATKKAYRALRALSVSLIGG